MVDVPGVTPPYDEALCAALARAGAEVELVTSRPVFGTHGASDLYRVTEEFHRLSSRVYRKLSGTRLASERSLLLLNRLLRLGERLPDMLRYSAHARRADVVHYQWLGLEEIAAYTLPPKRPRVFTAHDIFPREVRRWQAHGFERLMSRMDAVIVHSRSGADRLVDAGVAAARIHVIPHGAFEHLTRLRDERPLPRELAAVEEPVILFFGFISAYKGVDVLVDAFASLQGEGELWIVGQPRIPIAELRRRAGAAWSRVRLVPRFVEEAEVPALFRRADVVVLPYREIDQSGVFYTALAFGAPLIVSSVGGFVEAAEDHGVARLVPPNDAAALAAELRGLLSDSRARSELSAAALRAAAGPFSWDSVAQETLDLYERLLA